MSTEREARGVGLHPVVGRAAVVCFASWAGRAEVPCRVIGETPKKWRLAFDAEWSVPGRARMLRPDQTILAPKHAVRFATPNAQVQPTDAPQRSEGVAGRLEPVVGRQRADG